MKGDEENDTKDEVPRFWHTRTDSRSKHILIAFISVTIFMGIVVASVGAYGYFSWQEWKRGPQIRVEEGLFEFKTSDTPGEADVTVHISLVNQGRKTSDHITLEWLIMPAEKSHENMVIHNGSAELSNIIEGGKSRESFNITLQENDYVLAYRVYEGGLFSHEARQSIKVGPDDVGHEMPDTISVPEFSSLLLPIIVMLLIVFNLIFRRRHHGRRR